MLLTDNGAPLLTVGVEANLGVRGLVNGGDEIGLRPYEAFLDVGVGITGCVGWSW